MLRIVARLLILASALGGCDALERQQAADTEKVLAAAGFQRLRADSAEGREDLASLPPHRIVAQHRDAESVYLYVDPQNCRCVYAGGPDAYAIYSELERKKETARSMAADDF
jgi:hypothetical protein